MLIFGAFAHLLMADHFCQATIKGGPAITPDSLYKRAETIFTRAGLPSAANNAAVATVSSSFRSGAASGAQHEIGVRVSLTSQIVQKRFGVQVAKEASVN